MDRAWIQGGAHAELVRSVTRQVPLVAHFVFVIDGTIGASGHDSTRALAPVIKAKS